MSNKMRKSNEKDDLKIEEKKTKEQKELLDFFITGGVFTFVRGLGELISEPKKVGK